MIQRNTDSAVTDVISFIIVTVIITSTVALILFWALPYMDNQRAGVRADSALIQFTGLNDVINTVVHQGKNASKIVNIVTEKGDIDVGSQGTRLIIYYSLNSSVDLNVTGLGDAADTLFKLELKSGSVTAFTVNVTYLSPSAPTRYEDESFTANTGFQTVSLSNGVLTDTVRIDIKTSDAFNRLVGRVWLFDLGYIRYRTSSASQETEVIAENQGVIRGNTQSSYLVEQPVFRNYTNTTVFHVLQYRPKQTLAGGGSSATFRFTIKLDDTYLRENIGFIPVGKQLKMQMFGQYADAWTLFFDREQGYTKQDMGTSIDSFYYHPGGQFFTLLQSVLALDMRMI